MTLNGTDTEVQVLDQSYFALDPQRLATFHELVDFFSLGAVR